MPAATVGIREVDVRVAVGNRVGATSLCTTPYVPIGVHRGSVRGRHDHAVAERLQVAAPPLPFGACLEQHASARPFTEHCGESLPTGGDAAVRDRAVVGFDAPPTLALVPLHLYDHLGGRTPGSAPRRQTVSA